MAHLLLVPLSDPPSVCGSPPLLRSFNRGSSGGCAIVDALVVLNSGRRGCALFSSPVSNQRKQPKSPPTGSAPRRQPECGDSLSAEETGGRVWTHVTGMRDGRVATGSGSDVMSGRRRAARAGGHESCRTADSDCVQKTSILTGRVGTGGLSLSAWWETP